MASGWLADRYSRRLVLAATAAAIAAFQRVRAPASRRRPHAARSSSWSPGFILLGLAFGQASGVIASSFAQRNRYTASALTSDLAWLFGAGFAPLAAPGAGVSVGADRLEAYLLSGALVTLVALWPQHYPGPRRSPAQGHAGPRLVRIRVAVMRMRLVLAALAAGLALAGCGPSAASGQTGHRRRFSLTDTEGRSVTERDLLGRPSAVFFGFTYCPEVCPTTLGEPGAALGPWPGGRQT